MAPTFRRRSPRRIARRAAIWRTAQDRGCGHRSGNCEDSGERAEGRYALEFPGHGQGQRTVGLVDMFPNFPALKDFLAFWEKVTRRTPVRSYRCALETHQASRTARHRRRVPVALIQLEQLRRERT
jgi:hypothetical protein